MIAFERAAIEQAAAPALVVDGDGSIVVASAGILALLHCDRGDLPATLAALGRDALALEDWEAGAALAIVRRDERVITVRASVIALDATSGTRLLILRDVTAEQHHLAELAFRAEHDAVSQLNNREYIAERIGRWLDAGRPVTLVAVELQRFDALVSPLGDQYSGTLLSAAARRVEDIADADDIIARVGPTHLLIARPGHGDEEDALDLCVDIVDAIGTTLEFDGTTFPTAAVCGAAIAGPGESAETALHAVALALRQALTAEVDMELYSEPLRNAERRRITVERALELAVATKGFELYLQPVVATRRQGLVGYEGLARWRHPVLGPVSPLEFIPLAERAGLMRAIGEWSVETAIRVLSNWRATGVDLVPIALNLSAPQLLDGEFVRWMIDTISNHEARGMIVAEVKEGLLLSGRVNELMHELAASGIRLAVDGFGTGSSALAYLGDLPVDVVKIDRCFVPQLGHERTRILLRSAIDMAHALGMHAVAEGVETEAEADVLTEIGCDGIQGYYVGAPEPAPLVHRYDVIG